MEDVAALVGRTHDAVAVERPLLGLSQVEHVAHAKLLEAARAGLGEVHDGLAAQHDAPGGLAVPDRHAAEVADVAHPVDVDPSAGHGAHGAAAARTGRQHQANAR